MNGILCGGLLNGNPRNFTLNFYCNPDEVCTGATNAADAVYEFNKAELCSKGKFECDNRFNLAN